MRFARAHNFPILMDPTGAGAWNLYMIQNAIPTNYVVDTAGIVVGGMVGYSESTILGWVSPYLTGISETQAQPLEFTRVGANPVVGHSAVRFNLPKASNVSLRVFSTSGALVRTLVNGQMPAGANTVNWNLQDNTGSPVSNGLYLYELNTGSQAAQAKVSVLN